MPDLPFAHDLMAALSGSVVTLAELDANLHYTALHNPGMLLGAVCVLGRSLHTVHGLDASRLSDLAMQALSTGLAQEARMAMIGRIWQVRITPLSPNRLALLASEVAPLLTDFDLLSTLFEGLHDGLILLDSAGHIRLINAAATTLLAPNDEVLLDRTWVEFHTAWPNQPLISIDQSLLDGQVRHARVQLPNPLGGERTYDIRTMPLLDDHGRLTWLLVHLRDMTEPLWFAAQMRQHERLLATGRLAAVVAHEVNSPLQSIETCLHMAGRMSADSDRERYLRLAREEIKRISVTLRQLLDLYRPSAAPMQININTLIERVFLLTEPTLRRRAIQIQCNLSDNLPMLIGRPDEITQVLINLVFNAMQAMLRGGRLVVMSDWAADAQGQLQIIIRVSDNGMGISPDNLPHIFEPFFTTRPDGTGLGLAICQRILADHDGQIMVEHSSEEGTCFRVELPVKEG
ncbi:two-component system sensor histidine kinase NtrB [Candidatus Oscillochloris fontis]|uniref:two-component system sensor histidine kinase NtrB n=1 Tax=Candidatus Oscillochloris fontis TaxID=2496868 RepID=UPI00137555B8|nr:ATP-binding protein [Candidatus Oscillochloris fontis]